MFVEDIVDVKGHILTVGTRQFNIKQINATDILTVKPSVRGPVLGASLLMLASTAAFGSVLPQDQKGWAPIVGIATFIAAVVWLCVRQKPTYRLILTTSSGNIAATASRDFDTISRIRREINDAMAQS